MRKTSFVVLYTVMFVKLQLYSYLHTHWYAGLHFHLVSHFRKLNGCCCDFARFFGRFAAILDGFFDVCLDGFFDVLRRFRQFLDGFVGWFFGRFAALLFFRGSFVLRRSQ